LVFKKNSNINHETTFQLQATAPKANNTQTQTLAIKEFKGTSGGPLQVVRHHFFFVNHLVF
jgi:hypothetical protein